MWGALVLAASFSASASDELEQQELATFSVAQGRAGQSMAAAGDYTGDGVEDLVVLMPTLPPLPDGGGLSLTGLVYVLAGQADGGFATPFPLQAPPAPVGARLLGRCDVDGDQRPDVVLASGETVRVHLGAGGFRTATVSPPVPTQEVSLACVPGGGSQPVLLGVSNWPSPGQGVLQGRVSLFSFGPTAHQETPVVIGANSDACGSGVATYMSGSTAYLVAGCRGDGVFNRGSVRVVPRPPASSVTIPAPTNHLDFGARVDAIGDFDGDGEPNVAVGGAKSVAGGAPLSAVYVLERDGGILFTEVLESSIGPTISLARVGDVNGDGYSDFAVGTRSEDLPPKHLVHVIFGRGDGGSNPPSIALQGKDDFGTSLAGLGDRNGDGFGDFAVSAPAANSSKGKIFLVHGRARGPASIPGETFQTAVNSFARAGDVDGDGLDDVIFARRESQETLVFLRASSAPVGTTPTLLMTTTESVDVVVDGAGDVNGDGFADVLVGSPDERGGRGAVRLFRWDRTPGGMVEAWKAEGDSGARLGAGVAGVGDVDGDGYDDIVVGAPRASNARGAFRVYRGGPQGIRETSFPEVLGAPGSTARLGAAVARAGDFNGDGRSDFVVTSPGTDSVAVYGITDEGLTQLWGQGPVVVGLGAFVSGGHDLDGDGLDDVVVAGQGSLRQGKLAVIFGRQPGGGDRITWVDLVEITPGGTRPEIGAVASVGDVDGDGLGDVVAGSGSTAQAVLFLGVRGSGLERSNWTPEVPAMSSGAQVAGVGDVNGDGFTDFVVSARGLVDLRFFPGGDLGPGRPFGLLQRIDGAGRGAGFHAPAGATVVLGALLRDELGVDAPLRLEVEVLQVGTALTGTTTVMGLPGVQGVVVEGLAPGRYHWRARVVSGGRAGRWRSFGGNGEAATDFSIGLVDSPPHDAGVADAGGVALEDAGTVSPDAGGVAPDAGAGPGGLGPREFGAVGCGCDAGALSPLLVAALATALAHARRRRR
jgi:hypothetical protein